jgi:serine/threonine protein kinase/formylglycine-generating enzyme required for sulfatase activity
MDAKALVGRKLGSYTILSLLGQGGMGVVCLAEHESLGRKAAIKLLKPELTERDDVVQRFFNEARAANQINHPGIVDIYDYAHDETDGAYLVMEYLQGKTLQAMLTELERLPVANATLITRRIASPLAAAHAANIVHRDLKPENIFILPDPDHPGDLRIKLLDFGVAKLTDGKPSLRTQTGMLLGTPYYMSPEQCHGAKLVDHRADIYALGVIVYQMLAGSMPFDAEGFGELLLKHQTATPPRLCRPGLDVTPAVEAVVMRALAKEPEKRFQTVRELAGALAHAAGIPLDGALESRRAGMSAPRLLAAVETLIPQAITPVLDRQALSSHTGTSSPPDAETLRPLDQAAPQAAPPPVAPVAPSPVPKTVASYAGADPHAPGFERTSLAPEGALSPTPPPKTLVGKTPSRELERVQAEQRRFPSAMLRGFGALLVLGIAGVVIFLVLDKGPQKAGTGKPSDAAAESEAKEPADGTTAKTSASDDAAVKHEKPRTLPRVVNADRMALVPAGPYSSGKNEKSVTLAAFYIDRHEVTVADYRRCIKGGGCDGRKLDGTELPGQVAFKKSPRCNFAREGAANHPLNCVSWAQAAAYCKWAKKRLPTRLEWEKAARGTDGRRFPWGAEAADCARAVIKKANKEGCGTGQTWAVGSRSPKGDSPYGLRDLIGNVAEWTASGKRHRRALCGGGFTDDGTDLSVLSCARLPEDYRLEDLGFRCAWSAVK